MSNYAIMRFAKYKVRSVANIERHQNHCERLNVERYRKALRISEIMRLFSCTYAEAEGIYYIERHTAKHTPLF